MELEIATNISIATWHIKKTAPFLKQHTQYMYT